MHRSWQDLRQVREQAKGKIPALKAARSHHTAVALVFAVIVVVLLAAALHERGRKRAANEPRT
jgi:hypothetical protein